MDIRLESVKNIRDLSEYGCGPYIRSAHLCGLTERDGAFLRERYDLRTVIDLRTTQETMEKPDAVIPGVTYIHIPIFDEAVPGVSHERQTDEVMRYIPEMTEFYRELATRDRYTAQLRRALAIIRDPDRQGAVLWHCTEGKDRCGILSALFLLSRGVSRQAVLRDYLKTNRVNLTKAWKYYFLILLAKRDAAFAAGVRDAYLARRKYLEPILPLLEQLAAE